MQTLDGVRLILREATTAPRSGKQLCGARRRPMRESRSTLNASEKKFMPQCSISC
jgi:hypothetical protein